MEVTTGALVYNAVEVRVVAEVGVDHSGRGVTPVIVIKMNAIVSFKEMSWVTRVVAFTLAAVTGGTYK